MALATSSRSSSARTSLAALRDSGEVDARSASSAPWAGRAQQVGLHRLGGTVAYRTEAQASVGSTSGTDSAVTTRYGGQLLRAPAVQIYVGVRHGVPLKCRPTGD